VDLLEWSLAATLLVSVTGFLGYHRGRHVQATLDRRAESRRRRRFSMSKVVDFGQSETYRLHAFGQSGREMPVPQVPAAVVAPPEVASVEFAPDGQSFVVTNRNAAEGEVNVVIAVSAGGLGASVSLVCRPEVAVLLTIEEA
jgi:hypothetical protein